MSSYGRDTTTDEVLEGIDLSGKRILITGSSSGLGEESARALASKGAAISMAARNPEKNEAAAARIREKVPGAALDLRTLDLASLESVRRFAKGFLADHQRLDVLLDNAGVMCCPQGTTSDGFETQLGTNHIGHFLLTGLLAPALVASAPSRVVALSSAGHGIAGIDFDDPMFERREYDPWLAYGQSKTANALFALELDRRLANRGVSAYSVHPGMIMTELARHMTAELLERMQQRVKERAKAAGAESPGMSFKSVEAGAATQVWAATTGDLADHGGAYLADCQLGVKGRDQGERSVEPHAQDPEAAARLWTVSEGWVGQTFDL
jgi:NAD(P)-dependent dehydrogenase (short-subunit alcohol dehydrogenase family)